MSAERLREAAARLREAVGGTTWVPECGRWWLPDLGDASVAEADVNVARARDERIGAYIALMGPGVALALADWLDDLADHDPSPLMPTEAGAFEVADAVLGGERS